MADFRKGIGNLGGLNVEKYTDYARGINGLPKSDVVKFLLKGDSSVVIRPSGTEPKIKAYISVTATNRKEAKAIENGIKDDIEKIINKPA